jgi:chemotaxis protein MotB
MPTFRVALICVLAGLASGPIGCCCGGGRLSAMKRDRSLAQRRAWDLYNQNQLANQSAGSAASERDQLRQQLGAAQQELANLKGERADLMNRYDTLVNSTKNGSSPLSEDATNQLSDLASRYPGFEFDPKTGVSKFHSDVLFNSGSSDVRPEAQPLLREFAGIMNSGTSQELNILVVGHTDDRPVAKATTKQKHTDNWGLSTNRADQVVRNLITDGVKAPRCGAAGYGPYQPLVPNTDEKTRQRNRRVEIFVLAPNASVAGWDNPGQSTN